MRVIQRHFRHTSRADVFRIVPLGDVHLGAAACDEGAFRSVVAGIAADPRCYWIGMGDYCDFINRSDKRFDPASLADWIGIRQLGDIAKVQLERFLDIVKPIAPRCLGLLEGNHETEIHKHYENDVYSSIVTQVKAWAKMKDDAPLALGYYGWLTLSFMRTTGDDPERCARFDFNLHHGFTGGKLAGAKALDMQRWLWTHNADVVLFGHSHNHGIQPEAVEEINRAGTVRQRRRIGAYTGTFLRTTQENATTYSEIKGYMPLPIGGVEITLRPGAAEEHERLRVATA